MKRIDSNRLKEMQEEVSHGKVFKEDYKELCDWIGWKVATSRKQQFGSICHWMDVEKVDSHYIISKVYDEATALNSFKKPGKVSTKEINPQDYVLKNPVGRPRTKKPKLTIKELEERQGYSLYFRSTAKYIEPAFRIIGHDILNNNGVIQYTLSELISTLGMVRYDSADSDTIEYLINGNPELSHFWYYVNSCCENVIQVNIKQGLGDRKHIFDFTDVYYNSDWKLTPLENKFATEEQNKIISQIVNDSIQKWNLSGYYALFFSQAEERTAATQARIEISRQIKDQIGWTYWGKGYEIRFTPQIPKNAISYLKDADISRDRKIINELMQDKIIKILSDKNKKCLNYDSSPDVQPKIIIGTGTNITKEAHETFVKTVTDIVDTYLVLK